jgi:hypothetical protein
MLSLLTAYSYLYRVVLTLFTLVKTGDSDEADSDVIQPSVAMYPRTLSVR